MIGQSLCAPPTNKRLFKNRFFYVLLSRVKKLFHAKDFFNRIDENCDNMNLPISIASPATSSGVTRVSSDIRTVLSAKWNHVPGYSYPLAKDVDLYVQELFKSFIYFCVFPAITFRVVACLYSDGSGIFTDMIFPIFSLLVVQVLCTIRLLVHLRSSKGLSYLLTQYRKREEVQVDDCLCTELKTPSKEFSDVYIEFTLDPNICVQRLVSGLSFTHAKFLLDGKTRQFGFMGFVYNNKYKASESYGVRCKLELPLPKVYSSVFSDEIRQIFFQRIAILTSSEEQWAHLKMRFIGREHYDLSYYPLSIIFHLMKLTIMHQGILPQWDPDKFDPLRRRRAFCSEFVYYIVHDAVRAVNVRLKRGGCSPLPYPVTRYEYLEGISPYHLHTILEEAKYI